MSYKIVDTYYINECPGRAIRDTGLDLESLGDIVGKFRKGSCREGQLRGKIVVYWHGTVQIRHHFNNKLLWEV